MYKIFNFLITIPLFIILGCISPTHVDNSQNGEDLTFTINEVLYDASIGKVKIIWSPPAASDFQGYKLYFTSITNNDGSPNLNTMKSTGNRSNISKAQTEFLDNPDIADTTYFYMMRAFRIRVVDTSIVYNTIIEDFDTTVFYDTIYGSFSNVKDCKIITDKIFNINNGDIFTKIPQCSLYLKIQNTKIEKLRFSQSYSEYIYKDSSKVKVYFSNADSVPSNDELQLLKESGYLNTELQVASGAEYKIVPDFSNSIYMDSEKNSYSWTLALGNGVKNVWAEVQYKNNKGELIIDTLHDNIRIAPYNVKFKFRNETHPERRQMRFFDDGFDLDGLFRQYYLYTDSIAFSFSTLVDETFSDTFSVWLCFSDSSGILSSAQFFETNAKRMVCSQNDATIYSYSVNPKSSEGLNNLRSIRYTKAEPPLQGQLNNQVALTLRTSKNNDFAVEGSYWGKKPYGLSPYNTLENLDTTYFDSPEKNYTRIMYLNQTAIADRGVKEFAIHALFKGKYFKENRIVTSGRIFNGNTGVRSFIDKYVPAALYETRNGIQTIFNDTVITSTFTYSLAQNPSVVDKGRAHVSMVELLVAKMPSSMVWKVDSTPRTITLENLLQMRHDIYPYKVNLPSNSIAGVKWENVDPSDWSSGDYIFAVVTSDEFGNRNISYSNNSDVYGRVFSNPFRVKVQTGK